MNLFLSYSCEKIDHLREDFSIHQTEQMNVLDERLLVAFWARTLNVLS